MWRNTTARNVAVIRRFFAELWNGGSLSAADTLLAPGHVHHVGDGDLTGTPEGVKQFVAGLRATFPDMRTTLEDLIAAGDKVVVRVTISGTYQGQGEGVERPAAGKQVRCTGIDIFRLAGGKIVERWGELDALGFQQQLGATSNPG
jgi:predicted ester cyclase